MADKSNDSPGPGRPTMFDEKLPRSSFTAPNGLIEFLKRAGRQNTVSGGIRVVIGELVKKDEKYRDLMRQLEEDGYDVGNIFDEPY